MRHQILQRPRPDPRQQVCVTAGRLGQHHESIDNTGNRIITSSVNELGRLARPTRPPLREPVSSPQPNAVPSVLSPVDLIDQPTRTIRTEARLRPVHDHNPTEHPTHRGQNSRRSLGPNHLTTLTWQKVQDVLSGNRNGEKQRTHTHYLKSSVYCAQCGSRLIISHNTNRHGTTYPYFVCLGRHQRRTSCQQPAMRVEAVEQLVEDSYATFRLSASEAQILKTYLTDECARMHGNHDKERADLDRREAALKAEQLKLLQAHYAGAVPLQLLRTEQDRISGQLDSIQRDIQRLDLTVPDLAARLEVALQQLVDIRQTYLKATPSVRRRINQATLSRIEIGNDQATGNLKPPFSDLLHPNIRKAAKVYAAHVNPADGHTAVAKRLLANAAGPLKDSEKPRPFLTPSRVAGGVKEHLLAVAVGTVAR
jgi:site-specific DNA recombinase